MGRYPGSACNTLLAVLETLLERCSPLSRTAPHSQAQLVRLRCLLPQAGSAH